MKPILIEDPTPKSKRVRKKRRSFIKEWKRRVRVKAIGKMRLKIKAKWDAERKKEIRREYLLRQLEGHDFARELYHRTGFLITGMHDDVCTDEHMLRGMFRHTFGKDVDQVFFEQEYNATDQTQQTFRNLNRPLRRPRRIL